MSDTQVESSIPSDFPVAGRALLADITFGSLWRDTTLQYYLGDASTLAFAQEFRDSYNTRFDSNSDPDQNFAYTTQAVRSFKVIDNVIDTDFVRVTNSNHAQNTRIKR